MRTGGDNLPQGPAPSAAAINVPLRPLGCPAVRGAAAAAALAAIASIEGDRR